MERVACNHRCRWALWLVPETHGDTTYKRCSRLHPESLTSTQSSHLTILQLPVWALACSFLHSCLELDLNGPCLVHLLLTCALYNNEFGSSPMLGKAPLVQFHTAHCTQSRQTQTRSKQVLCLINGENLGFLIQKVLPWSSFQPLLQQV